MCGILAIIGEEYLEPDILDKLKNLIDHRGPDYSAPVLERQSKCGLKLKLSPSVLHLRGDILQKQPVIDKAGNILMFNGQIYEFFGKPLNREQSDTLFLSLKLGECKTRDEIAKIFSLIDGPFAFVYWHENFSSLFYGRDLFGRKSLCTFSKGDGIPLVVSSVGMQSNKTASREPHTWAEVDCRGIHSLNFSVTRQGPPIKSIYLWNIDDAFPLTSKCETVARSVDLEVHDEFLLNPLPPLNGDQRLPKEFDVEEVSIAIEGLKKKLIQAISKRIVYNRDTCLRCREVFSSSCNHSKIAVAFSGGLDSTLLALFIDQVYDEKETIDLITVAFKNDSPDRESVGIAFRELRNLRPNRTWRLVISDITKISLENERQKLIHHLIMPCNTVVDDSLGCACWFIGRGCGRSIDSSIEDANFEEVFENFLEYDTDNNKDLSKACDEVQDFYCCPATMFFAGMGIDEQLGGYSSHRAAWSRSSSRGLVEEISFQMRRISSRNLGRDDRTFSHHGRDVKLPYLDFSLVSYLNQLPVGLKVNLDEPLNVGPKKLLRALALQSGLQLTSRQVKRALQFGTRIAKLESSGENGSDICQRLTQLNSTIS